LSAGREGKAVRWAAAAGDEVLVGESKSLPALLEAWGERPLEARDWKETSRSTAPEAGTPTPPGLCLAPAALHHDVTVAAYLLNPIRRRYPLDELLEETGIDVAVEGEGAELAHEAAAVHVLAARQREEIARLGLGRLLEEIELPLVEVLCWLERAGVKLDTVRLAEIAVDVESEIDKLEREVWELCGEEFTIGSPQQLSRILFDKLGLSKKRRGKTGFSTDARVLQAIRDEHPIVAKVEAWRELSKLKSTYLDALPSLISERTGRLHTTFNQTATTTGRLSSTNPNLQNIPIRTPLGRKIRSCFIAEPGSCLISADYSQVELRILAHVAGEQVLKEVFARGEDVHAATAAEVLKVPPEKIGPGERSRAKAVNFGIVYGLSAHGLSEQLQISHEEADEYIKNYLGRFPAVQTFIENTIAEAIQQGHVKTLFGRMRPIPELRSRQYQTRSLGERLAVNTVIQGTAADIIKVAMVACHRQLSAAGLRTRIVLTVHDELLFEGPEEELERACEIVKQKMESACELDPPLVVDLGIGKNWLEAK
jgi:DNA polymerase I